MATRRQSETLANNLSSKMAKKWTIFFCHWDLLPIFPRFLPFSSPLVSPFCSLTFFHPFFFPFFTLISLSFPQFFPYFFLMKKKSRRRNEIQSTSSMSARTLWRHMRVMHEGVVKLYDVDVFLLMLPAMLALSAACLLAHPAPFSEWLMCSIMCFDVRGWR